MQKNSNDHKNSFSKSQEREKAHSYRMPDSSSAAFLQTDDSYGTNSRLPSIQSIKSTRPSILFILCVLSDLSNHLV